MFWNKRKKLEAELQVAKNENKILFDREKSLIASLNDYDKKYDGVKKDYNAMSERFIEYKNKNILLAREIELINPSLIAKDKEIDTLKEKVSQLQFDALSNPDAEEIANMKEALMNRNLIIQELDRKIELLTNSVTESISYPQKDTFCDQINKFAKSPRKLAASKRKRGADGKFISKNKKK